MTQTQELLATMQQYNKKQSLEEISTAASQTEKDRNAVSVVPNFPNLGNEATLAGECL